MWSRIVMGLCVVGVASGCDADVRTVAHTVEHAHGPVRTDPDAATAPDTTEPTDTRVDDTALLDSLGDTQPTDSAATDSGLIDTVAADTVSLDTIPEDTATTAPDIQDDTTAPPTCRIGALDGTCRHVSACGPEEAAVEGYCEGSPQVRCCVPSLDRCSVAGVSGTCLEVADCPAPDWKSTSGKCPGPANVRCCTPSGATNPCDPEARPTPNAGLVVEEPGDPGCPPGMAMVADFCIDRYEASLVLDADPTTTFTPFVKPDVPVRAVSIAWTVPQGHISGTLAQAACVAADKRLCSSEEWLRACQGSAGNTYPYGDLREPQRCNDDRREHVAYEYFQTTASWVFSELDHRCLDQLPNSIDLAGENDGCVSEDGVYDLMGNRHEWVDDPAGTFRGGFFDDTSINGEGCLYRTIAHDIGHWDYSTGFRCCADPLP